MKKVKPFLGRVAPFEGESLSSLLVRVGVKNVIRSLPDILTILGISGRHPELLAIRQAESSAEFAVLLGVDVEAIRSRMHSVVERKGLSESVSFNGTLLPRRFINTTLRRCSPTSLRDVPFGRSTWMLHPLTFCPQSMENLISACHACGHHFGWLQFRGLHVCDACGQSVRRARPGKVDWKFRRDAALIASLVDPNASIREQTARQMPEPFRNWEPGDIFVAIVELGFAVRDARKEWFPKNNLTSFEIFSDFDVSHLVRGYQVVRGWPHSLKNVLTEIAEWRSGDLRALVGPFAKFFSTGYAVTPFGALIRATVPDLLHSGAIPLNAYRGSRSLWAAGESLVSEKGGEKQFGLCRKVIRRLSKNGKCCISRRNSMQSATFYNRHLLERSISLLKSSIRAPQCATAVGAPVYCVDSLADAGLISRTEDHDALLLAGEPIYLQSSMDALLEQLADVAITDSDDSVSLAAALCGQLNPHAWAEALRGVVVGKIAVAKRIGGEAVFDGLRIERGSANQFFSNLMLPELPKELTTSCLGAARALGTSGILLQQTIKAGMLHGTRTHTGLNVTLGDIADFYRDYIFSPDAAKVLGTKSLAVTHQMKRRRFRPIATIFRTSLWRRSDVQTVFPELPATPTQRIAICETRSFANHFH
jgi:hypothetical protein